MEKDQPQDGHSQKDHIPQLIDQQKVKGLYYPSICVFKRNTRLPYRCRFFSPSSNNTLSTELANSKSLLHAPSSSLRCLALHERSGVPAPGGCRMDRREHLLLRAHAAPAAEDAGRGPEPKRHRTQAADTFANSVERKTWEGLRSLTAAIHTALPQGKAVATRGLFHDPFLYGGVFIQ